MAQQKTTGEEIARKLTQSEMTTLTVDSDVLSEIRIRIRITDLSRDADQQVPYNEHLRQELLEGDNDQ